MSRLADFYIIGAMKCATSTLHEQLARRAIFHMSDPKEPNFFNDSELYATGMEDYVSLFSGAKATQITGESSTHYTKLPTYTDTVERIAQHTPEARFVYVMRHPVQRLVSHYIHEWSERTVNSPISDATIENQRFIAYSSYARQLKPFIERFGKDKIMPVFFEYLTTHKEEELKRVAQFLGDDTDEAYSWYQEAGQTNVSKDRLRKSALRDGALSIGIVRSFKNALPTKLREQIKSLWRMEKRPELTATSRQIIEEKLDQDLLELGQMFGLSLNCANYSDVARSTIPTWMK